MDRLGSGWDFEASERIAFDINAEYSIPNNLVYLSQGTYGFAVYHGELTETAPLRLNLLRPQCFGPQSNHDSSFDEKQFNLFLTQNRYSLLRRGPLQIGIDGAGNLFIFTQPKEERFQLG